MTYCVRAQVGNHAELLHKGRLYAKLVKRQTESLT